MNLTLRYDYRMDALNSGFSHYTINADGWHQKQVEVQAEDYAATNSALTLPVEKTVKVKSGGSPSCPRIPVNFKPMMTSATILNQRQRSHQAYHEQLKDVADHKDYTIDQIYNTPENEL